MEESLSIPRLLMLWEYFSQSRHHTISKQEVGICTYRSHNHNNVASTICQILQDNDDIQVFFESYQIKMDYILTLEKYES